MITTQMDTTTREDIESLVKTLIDSHLKVSLEEFVRINEGRAKELSIIERVIRVEEELKALREIETLRIEAMDKRFEAVDKRFEALQREMNARFEAMDKRFEAVDKRFEAVDKRFEAVDKRFEALQREMNARFEAMDKRFSFMQWFIGAGFTVVSILIALFGLYGR